MAAGNRHLGYKEALNAIEEQSPGAKHAFYFGFLERVSPLFVPEAQAEQEQLQSCAQCGGGVEERFRFCPWCAAPLRRKLVEFFPAHPRDAGKALRVSRYLDEDPHVRFSVWDETGTVEGAVSVDELQAARLSNFLRPSRPRSHGLTAVLRDYAAELAARRSSTGSRKTTSS